jgi:hypothetical protein
MQIALSLVMGKLVELTGLAHYYIIVACLGRLAIYIQYMFNCSPWYFSTVISSSMIGIQIT